MAATGTGDRGPVTGHRCICGSSVNAGYIGLTPVQLCTTRDHVMIGRAPQRVYIYVENPGDVIEAVDHCWLCGGIDPNETVTVAREYPDGPKCPAYKAKVHTGCWQDMAP